MEICIWIKDGDHDGEMEKDKTCPRCEAVIKVRRSPKNAGKELYCPNCGTSL